MEAELERLSVNSKQMIQQLHASHAVNMKALDKSLKADLVMFPFCCLPSGLFLFLFLTGSPFILVWIYCCGTKYMYVFYCHS